MPGLAKCPECDADVNVAADAVKGEIVTCPDCGAELEVKETEPGLKSATASNVNKPAKMETGLVVQVPPFVNAGEKIRIDTNEGEYMERVRG